MSIKLQLRRGLETDLPTLAAGEPGFCTDSYKLFIGSAAGNQGVAMLASPIFTGLVTVDAGRVVMGDSRYNLAVGIDAFKADVSGTFNSAFGWNALLSLTAGNHNSAFGAATLYTLGVNSHDNSAFGSMVLWQNATGNDNSGFGSSVMNAKISGSYNSGFGERALAQNTIGGYNIAMGSKCFYTNQIGDRNVGLGYASGYYETGSDKLFIDNQQRTNEADGRIKALIYGVFDALTANQRLSFNGRILVRECPNYANNAAALAGGLTSGELYTVTGTDPLQVAKVV